MRRSAERIAGQMGSTPVVGEVSITGAIGAALYPRHGDGLDELVRSADIAMYEAKSSGVSHRIADSMSVDFAREMVSDSYRGPDRRRHAATVGRRPRQLTLRAHPQRRIHSVRVRRR